MEEPYLRLGRRRRICAWKKEGNAKADFVIDTAETGEHDLPNNIFNTMLITSTGSIIANETNSISGDAIFGEGDNNEVTVDGSIVNG
jgi:hypothetical protein